MRLISRQAFARARDFVFDQGRPLDQARFRFLFEGGPAADVVRELAAYQNDDGGFGNALEPDIRTAASTAVTTQLAFELLRELRVSADEPIVTRGVSYLANTYDSERRIWEIVPAAVEDAPHGPWWTYAGIGETFGGCRLNPTAALVGLLSDYPALAPAAVLDAATAAVLARLDEPGVKVNPPDLQCLTVLAESEHLPATIRDQVRVQVTRWAPEVVVPDPGRWAEYTLQPLQLVRRPDSFVAAALDPELISTNLDYWVDLQQPDGSWPLTWSWAQVDADAWARAEVEWRGFHVVERLATLRAHGRVARDVHFA